MTIPLAARRSFLGSASAPPTAPITLAIAWRVNSYVSAAAAAPITPGESTMPSTFLGNNPASTARSRFARRTRSSPSLTSSRPRNRQRRVMERDLVGLQTQRPLPVQILSGPPSRLPGR